MKKPTVLDQLMELNPENKEKVMFIIQSFYEGQQKAKEADPWLISIINQIDIKEPSPEKFELTETIKTVLHEKLGKDYYDLLHIYFLEIGKAMGNINKEEVA